MDDFERSFQKIRAILKDKKWPGVEEGQSWGTPSLKVKGKMLVRVREPGVLVIMCNLEAKEMLLQVAPHIYFDLPHYKGYPAILARMDVIEDDEIAEMIEEHYRRIAPKNFVAEYDDAAQVKTAPSKAAKVSKPASKTPAKSPKPKPKTKAKA